MCFAAYADSKTSLVPECGAQGSNEKKSSPLDSRAVSMAIALKGFHTFPFF